MSTDTKKPATDKKDENTKGGHGGGCGCGHSH